MLTQKRTANSILSHHRLSTSKTLLPGKPISNRSISIPHATFNTKINQNNSHFNTSTSTSHNNNLKSSFNNIGMNSNSNHHKDNNANKDNGTSTKPSSTNNITANIQRIYCNAEKQYYVIIYFIQKNNKFYLGKGNNEDIVRRVLKTRTAWVEKEDSTNTFIHFKWQQDQKGYHYNRLVDSMLYRCVLNQLEFHDCLSNKQFLFRNLQAYCLKNNINLWQIVPPTFILNSKDQVNMQNLDRYFDYYEKYIPKHIKNSNSNIDKDITAYRRKLKGYFFNCNLKKILPKMPKINENFVDSQGEYLWIVKPTFLNRGRGIKVFSKMQTLYKYIEQNIAGYLQQSLNKDKEDDLATNNNNNKNKIDYIKRNSQCIKQSILSRDPANRQIKQKRQTTEFFDGNQYIRVQPRVPSIIKTDKFLVQKYLEKPLLIMNRKFDIRIWVLVTHNLNCYVFKEGYIRLSSMEYSVKDDEDNTFRHLTNNAVQKFSQNYGSICQGNQLPFSSLKQAMDEKGLDYDKTIQNIHNQITISLKAAWKSLNPSNRKFQFMIFGYDFMIDSNGHSWLIQVNNNPCIQQSSSILKSYLPRMLNDAFKLTLDQLFWGSHPNSKFSVQGYKDDESMWLRLNVQDK